MLTLLLVSAITIGSVVIISKLGGNHAIKNIKKLQDAESKEKDKSD